MQWDIPHLRGVGFVFEILQPSGTYEVLSTLYEHPRVLRSELEHLVDADAEADAPLVGLRESSGGTRRLLSGLCESGLVLRHTSASPGGCARYELAPLAAGLVESMAPVTDWAMKWFFAVALATRKRLKLPPVAGPILPEWRRPRLMTSLAIDLFEPQWVSPLMAYVDSAGEQGIGPSKLMQAINADLAALEGADAISRRLVPETTNSTLRYLVSMGLLEKYPDPPRVWYRPTRCGADLLATRWKVAEWGMAHDAELFKIVSASSVWYRRAGSGN